MRLASGPARRRFLVPEVVQSSAMDCGPAALKSLLDGYGIPVSYGRLREACQTDVDGTSIDTLEEIANLLGLQAEQIMLPADHVLLPAAQALPAIAVARLPDGASHFIVIWRHLAGLVQVMDPASGRKWVSASRMRRELYQHVMPVPAEAWREWAGSAEALATLCHRLRSLGLPEPLLQGLTRRALEERGWRSLAALDAATRAVSSLVRSRGLRRGREAARTLDGLFEEASAAWPEPRRVLPQAYWSVREAEAEEQLLMRGAVLVRVRGPTAASRPPVREAEPSPLPPELLAARTEAPSAPGRELLRHLAADGLLAPGALLAALFLAAGAVVIEALLLRGLLELTPQLGLSGQRLAALGALAAFLVLVLLLELPISLTQLRLGRRLEARLRIAFQRKIPLLSDRYFHSRLTSDMAERNHSLHVLRSVPGVGGQVVHGGFELLLTVAGLIWLHPADAPLAVLAALAALALPLAFQPLLVERDLRVRSHTGALGRFYLDALLGLVAVRVQGAERSLRSQHEALLTEWARARLGLQRAALVVQGAQAVVGYGLAAALLLSHLRRGGDLAIVLLLVYWALKLPVLGQAIAQGAWQYPSFRNVALRMLEPLGAPEEAEPDGHEVVETATPAGAGDGDAGSVPGEAKGVSISMRGVSIRAAGHAILEGVDVEVAAGSHVAVVGPSGAGKTSLLGLLLGWHRPAVGTLLVDGKPLRGEGLRRLRSRTAWVDPAVQLWNHSFLDNLRYGNPGSPSRPLAQVIDIAELRSLLEVLPDGHQTVLGEGGGLVSGGEGQRVRLGRALLRGQVRLVILDEPFRGLDRGQRSRLLARSRQLWQSATLLCVTHDVAETLSFDRVLVVEGGRIVEDGAPRELSQRPGSRYHLMLESEEAARRLWQEMGWRRMRLENGRLREAGLGGGD